jgi:hypothetical protein
MELSKKPSIASNNAVLGFFFLPAAKATTSYASGKEELIARKEVDKIKTPY